MAGYNMFNNYFKFSFGNDVQNEDGTRPVLGRRARSDSDDSLSTSDCWIKSRTNSSSSDQSFLSLESDDASEDTDSSSFLPKDDDVFISQAPICQSTSYQEFVVEHKDTSKSQSASFHDFFVENKQPVNQSASFYGSTHFYKNLGSDYSSVQDLSFPTASSVFNENIQQMSLEVLRSLVINPSANSGNVYGNETMMPYRHGKTLDVIKHCAFCKRNGETKEFYSTHIVKDCRGNVVCPILRKYVCPICKATGDQAHTLRHCPFKLKTPLQPTC